jgi:hypothetical protein
LPLDLLDIEISMPYININSKTALELLGEQHGREIPFSRPVANRLIEVDVSDEYELTALSAAPDLKIALIEDPYDVDPYGVDPYDV